MLMKAETSCLLVVDLQERLMPAIHQADQIIATGVWLIQMVVFQSWILYSFQSKSMIRVSLFF